MPAETANVNLLEQVEGATPVGRLINWALTYGRYIMIGTEIIVLLAFISRFSLDRKLTDLKEEIDQKQAILKANQTFETDIRTIQETLKTIKILVKDQGRSLELFDLVASLLPPDVAMVSAEVTSDTVTAKAQAGTNGGFSQFITNLQSKKEISNIELTNIKKSPVSGIEFVVIVHAAPKKPA